jgi:hypothetical protein
MMSSAGAWCFRVRAILGTGCKLSLPVHEWLMDGGASAHSIRMVAIPADQLLSECRAFALRGEGYLSKDHAEAAGQTWRARVIRALAMTRVGADFGDRSPGGGHVTRRGAELLFPGKRVLDDVHGLMTFECDPTPAFASMTTGGLMVGPSEETLAEALNASLAAPLLSGAQQVAYNFYAASLSAASADARFALLMIALEALIEPKPRPDDSRAHVRELIRLTQNSALPESEVASIIGTLKWLVDESISRTGRQLVRALGPRDYLDTPPEKFFDRCYAARSQLFHVLDPLPDWDEVGSLSATLELLVGDLITMT